jgi:hypothetical protein
VQLTEEQARALNDLSARTGLSIPELNRRSLAPLLEANVTEEDTRSGDCSRVDRVVSRGQCATILRP